MTSSLQLFQCSLRNYWKIKNNFVTSRFSKFCKQMSKKKENVLFFITCIFFWFELDFCFWSKHICFLKETKKEKKKDIWIYISLKIDWHWSALLIRNQERLFGNICFLHQQEFLQPLLALIYQKVFFFFF